MDLTTLAEKVIEYSEEDGTFKGTSDDAEGSIYNTGLALELLGRYVFFRTPYSLFMPRYRIIKEAKGSSIEDLDKVVDNIDLSLGNDENGALGFTHLDDSVSPLATTAALLRGLLTFKAAHALPESSVSTAEITQIAEYLVQRKQVGSLADAYHLISALRALQNSPVQPLVVSLEKASIAGII